MLDHFQRFCYFRRVVKVLPESGQRSRDRLNSSHSIGSLQAIKLQEMSMTVDKSSMLACFFSLAWTPDTRKSGSTIKTHSYNIANLKIIGLWYTWQLQNICSQHLLSLKAQYMSKKHSTGVPSSSQWQKTDNSPTAIISVHTSAMTLKTDAFWSLFLIDSSTYVSSSLIKSTTATREVYTAFLEVFLTKTCNSSLTGHD